MYINNPLFLLTRFAEQQQPQQPQPRRPQSAPPSAQHHTRSRIHRTMKEAALLPDEDDDAPINLS